MNILDVLTDMAKTGRLGPVFVGASWSDVTATLGEPWDMGTMSRRGKWPRLFAYGDLELSVCRCRKVSLICVQTWRDVVELPPSVAGGTGTFPAAIKQADLISALDEAGCPWQPYPPLTFGDQCSLVAIPSRANFTFEIPQGEEPVLNVMGLHGHGCSSRSPGPG
ncbi:hypothetical protein JL475_38405 [Streptomyces sp. M2CJ-2]|uniref:hypothetical protein n=1 Tax=Streptomyces sp. M2CJ-2 TaxID=2803948 RepID=UPI0019297A97|nr:hypothetical protein [Streptomyces sp. M2CJ-2]MBL3671635.1 hypothetical protein [Streptomyces sp. M2CJ-2]